MNRSGRAKALRNVFGNNIKLLRTHSGLSQAQLAEKVGISVPFFGAVERGEKWPSAGTVAEIAHALSVQPCDLLKPENASSRDARQVIAKLAVDIADLLNETVRTLGNIAEDED